MAAKFVNVDRDTPMLLPVDLRDWVPSNHIVHFILDAVDMVDDSAFIVNHRGTGSNQYPPRMLLALLIYSYATGRFSSREIERATHTDVAMRYICGGEHHPDHDTICTFRRRNRVAFEALFARVLLLAREAGKLKRVGTIAVDSTKIRANASKHAAVSYERAEEQLALLAEEVAKLTAMAERADSEELAEGYSIPAEIQRREERMARLREAKARIEERLAQKEETPTSPSKPGGTRKTTPNKMQSNFTDPDSRIMKAGSGSHYEQAYNAQAAVEVDSMLIVGQRISQSPNDKQELEPTVAAIHADLFTPTVILADSGFYSEGAVERMEQQGTSRVYAAVQRVRHGVRVEEMMRRAEPLPLPPDAPMTERMRHRLETTEGKRFYRLRKQTVEPVFGIIKHAMGFRQFLLRGVERVTTEWSLVCASYNMRRVFRLLKNVESLTAA